MQIAAALSQQQTEIVERLAGQAPGNVVVRARAGTGKTFTILRAVITAHETVTGRPVLLAAFNKEIATELVNKLQAAGAPSNIAAKTLHALGFGFVLRYWGGVGVENGSAYRARRLAEAVCGPAAPSIVTKAVALIADKSKEIYPISPSDADLLDIAARFELLPTGDAAEQLLGDAGWDAARIIASVHATLGRCRERDPENRIDFADMLWLPLQHGWVPARFSLVIIDEAQDMNAAQILLAQRCCAAGGRIVVVGDDRQCHPDGVMVSTDAGEVAVEKLDPTKQMIIPWNRNAQRSVGRRKFQMAARPYSGKLIDIVAAARTVPATPNHKLLCRWTTRTDLALCCTYLMWRADLGFRVGWCQVFNKTSKAFHVAHRARCEKADALWILKVHRNRTEASIHESQVAALYGLPTAPFEPVDSAQHLTADAITQTFAYLPQADQHKRAARCLRAYERDIDLPLYPWPGTAADAPQGRRTYFACYAANLLPELMSVPLPDRPNMWAPITSTARRDYTGLVHSLNVDQDHSYSANGVIVLNCIYGFRGADVGAFERLKTELSAEELGLTITYRCPKAVVALAKQIVPDYRAADTAPDGEIQTMNLEAALATAGAGDFILSRTNAPLVSCCLALLRRGQRAKIRGRDVGRGLVALVRELRARSIPEFIQRLSTHTEKEIVRVSKLTCREETKQQKIDALRDQQETLVALCEGLSGPKELQTRIEQLFEDAGINGHVLLSSVHRAKGLESDRVFLIKRTFRNTSNEGEESNIAYVAITRSKRVLVWVA